MRKNLDHETTTSMYYSLAHEAWRFWGKDPWVNPIPVLRIMPLYDLFGNAIETEIPGLADQPGWAMAQTKFDPDDLMNAVSITLNTFWLPTLWEDEVIVNILHELAHAHVGWREEHGPVWAKAAEEIGSFPQPAMLTRGAWFREVEFIPEEVYNLMHASHVGPTLDVV